MVNALGSCFVSFPICVVIVSILAEGSLYSPNFDTLACMHYGPGVVIVWGDATFGGNPGQRLWNIRQVIPTHFSFTALTNDGYVISWGDRRNGGQPDSATQSQLWGVLEVASTNAAFAALRWDGSVLAWGNTDEGGNIAGVAEELSENVASIYGNDHAFAAVKHDGSVVAWGSPGYGGSTERVDAALQGAVTIESTWGAFAALLDNGHVITWGDSMSGGDSSFPPTVDHALRGGSRIVRLFSSWKAFAALTEHGNVVAWGDSCCGGDTFPVDAELHNVTDVSSTWSAFAALRSDGSVVTWGLAERGGDVSSVKHRLSRGVVNISSTSGAFIAYFADGTSVKWGDTSRDTEHITTSTGTTLSLSSTGQASVALITSRPDCPAWMYTTTTTTSTTTTTTTTTSTSTNTTTTTTSTTTTTTTTSTTNTTSTSTTTTTTTTSTSSTNTTTWTTATSTTTTSTTTTSTTTTSTTTTSTSTTSTATTSRDTSTTSTTTSTTSTTNSTSSTTSSTTAGSMSSTTTPTSTTAMIVSQLFTTLSTPTPTSQTTTTTAKTASATKTTSTTISTRALSSSPVSTFTQSSTTTSLPITTTTMQASLTTLLPILMQSTASRTSASEMTTTTFVSLVSTVTTSQLHHSTSSVSAITAMIHQTSTSTTTMVDTLMSDTSTVRSISSTGATQASSRTTGTSTGIPSLSITTFKFSSRTTSISTTRLLNHSTVDAMVVEATLALAISGSTNLTTSSEFADGLSSALAVPLAGAGKVDILSVEESSGAARRLSGSQTKLLIRIRFLVADPTTAEEVSMFMQSSDGVFAAEVAQSLRNEGSKRGFVWDTLEVSTLDISQRHVTLDLSLCPAGGTSLAVDSCPLRCRWEQLFKACIPLGGLEPEITTTTTFTAMGTTRLSQTIYSPVVRDEEWALSAWGSCNAMCGRAGIQERDVICIGEEVGDTCSMAKPATEQQCQGDCGTVIGAFVGGGGAICALIIACRIWRCRQRRRRRSQAREVNYSNALPTNSVADAEKKKPAKKSKGRGNDNGPMYSSVADGTLDIFEDVKRAAEVLENMRGLPFVDPVPKVEDCLDTDNVIIDMDLESPKGIGKKESSGGLPFDMVPDELPLPEDHDDDDGENSVNIDDLISELESGTSRRSEHSTASPRISAAADPRTAVREQSLRNATPEPAPRSPDQRVGLFGQIMRTFGWTQRNPNPGDQSGAYELAPSGNLSYDDVPEDLSISQENSDTWEGDGPTDETPTDETNYITPEFTSSHELDDMGNSQGGRGNGDILELASPGIDLTFDDVPECLSVATEDSAAKISRSDSDVGSNSTSHKSHSTSSKSHRVSEHGSEQRSEVPSDHAPRWHFPRELDPHRWERSERSEHTSPRSQVTSDPAPRERWHFPPELDPRRWGGNDASSGRSYASSGRSSPSAVSFNSKTCHIGRNRGEGDSESEPDFGDLERDLQRTTALTSAAKSELRGRAENIRQGRLPEKTNSSGLFGAIRRRLSRTSTTSRNKDISEVVSGAVPSRPIGGSLGFGDVPDILPVSDSEDEPEPNNAGLDFNDVPESLSASVDESEGSRSISGTQDSIAFSDVPDNLFDSNDGPIEAAFQEAVADTLNHDLCYTEVPPELDIPEDELRIGILDENADVFSAPSDRSDSRSTMGSQDQSQRSHASGSERSRSSLGSQEHTGRSNNLGSRQRTGVGSNWRENTRGDRHLNREYSGSGRSGYTPPFPLDREDTGNSGYSNPLRAPPPNLYGERTESWYSDHGDSENRSPRRNLYGERSDTGSRSPRPNLYGEHSESSYGDREDTGNRSSRPTTSDREDTGIHEHVNRNTFGRPYLDRDHAANRLPSDEVHDLIELDDVHTVQPPAYDSEESSLASIKLPEEMSICHELPSEPEYFPDDLPEYFH